MTFAHVKVYELERYIALQNVDI